MLTDDQINAYHENGYIAIDNVLTMSEVEELRDVTDEFFEKARGLTENDDHFELEPTHSKENPKLRHIIFPYKIHPAYDKSMRHPRILEMVSQLIGHDLRQNGHKLNVKYSQGGSPVEWHQDWVFYPHTNDDLLAVGIAIDPMTMENGCLMMIPGSHREPIYDHHHRDGYFVGAVQEKNFPLKDAVPITLDAGGISIHHVRTLHGSEPNTSDHSRRLLLTQYCAVDAWPLRGITDWDTFNADIVRGESTNRPRLADVPVLMPYPEGEFGDRSIYEIQKGMEDRLYEVPK